MADKLHQLRLISTKNADLRSEVCRDVNNKQCMYRECNVCRNKDITFVSELAENGTENNAVFRWEWKRKVISIRRVTKLKRQSEQ